MSSLRYTVSAEGDLLEAWLYIAESNPQAADAVLDRIAEEARVLLDQPMIGRSRPELASGLRSWPTSTPYVLFYLADEDGIILVRVLHHARDIEGASFEP